MTVHLVGAGPGAADLLTLRAARLLGAAEAVVYDRLIDTEVLALIPRGAQSHAVGKAPGVGWTQEAINALLVELGHRFDVVVRLKGGDPYIFGRGHEELAALHAAGISTSVVPGITSALAAPLSAGISVTARGIADSVTIATATGAGGVDVDLARFATGRGTLVVLMGVARRANLATALVLGGLSPATPVAAVERASTERQRVVRTTLAELGALPLENPAVLIIGQAAASEAATAQVEHHIVGLGATAQR